MELKIVLLFCALVSLLVSASAQNNPVSVARIEGVESKLSSITENINAFIYHFGKFMIDEKNHSSSRREELKSQIRNIKEIFSNIIKLLEFEQSYESYDFSSQEERIESVQNLLLSMKPKKLSFLDKVASAFNKVISFFSSKKVKEDYFNLFTQASKTLFPKIESLIKGELKSAAKWTLVHEETFASKEKRVNAVLEQLKDLDSTLIDDLDEWDDITHKKMEKMFCEILKYYKELPTKYDKECMSL